MQVGTLADRRVLSAVGRDSHEAAVVNIRYGYFICVSHIYLLPFTITPITENLHSTGNEDSFVCSMFQILKLWM